MNQISSMKVIEKLSFKNLNGSSVDSKGIVSNSLKDYYFALSRYDLAHLRIVFLENFDYLLEFSEDKDNDSKLYEDIDAYFEFIKENIMVFNENDYKKLSLIIRSVSILMDSNVNSKDFYNFYDAYISLREDINRFRLSKNKFV